MADTSDRYALPFIAAGQAQKELTHNEAVNRIDTLLHLSVLSLSLSAPPPDAAPGNAWIVGAAATGAWSGHTTEIVSFDEGGWRFVVPVAGCLAWVIDLGVFAIWTNNSWMSEAWPVRAIQIGGSSLLAPPLAAIDDVSGGSMIDIEGRAAILAVLNVLRYMGLIAG